MTSPQKIVDLALENKIDYLVIADHDTVAGSVEASAYAKQKGFPIEIPVAAEYYTDIGDIVAVGVPTSFKLVKDHRELCQAVKECGGYTILPHPYDHHQLEQIAFPLIDCIEVFNSRCSETYNEEAAALAAKLNKPQVYGSDAHFLCDVCNCIFEYNGRTPFDSSTTPVALRYTTKFRKNLSQLVKSLKTRDLRLMWRIIKRMLYCPRA